MNSIRQKVAVNKGVEEKSRMKFSKVLLGKGAWIWSKDIKNAAYFRKKFQLAVLLGVPVATR